MKTCTTHIIEWDEDQEQYIRLPKRCLSYTIFNDGNSLVTINESILLDPKRDHSVAHHSGYYHTGDIELRVANIQPPYSNITKVVVRLIIETKKRQKPNEKE